MNKYAVMSIALTVMIGCTSPLYASDSMNNAGQMQEQTNATINTGTPDMDAEEMVAVPSADELRGMEVYSMQGEDVGKIEKVAVDEQTGKINYVTLEKGGFFGVGDEEIALPYEALSFHEDRIVLTVSADKLENAPQQASISDEQFLRNLQMHYGVAPSWNEETSMDEEKPSMQDNMQEY